MFGLNALDIVIILTIVASAVNGVRRGFTTEAMKLVAWAAAIFITVIAQPAAFQFAAQFIKIDMVANLTGIVVVFLIALVAFNYLGKFIGDRIKASFMGPIDRSLGSLFGLLRGAIVVSAAYLGLAALVPEKEHPTWVTQARLLPYVKTGALVIAYVTPDLFSKANNVAFGYDDEARDDLDDLVEDVSDEG